METTMYGASLMENKHVKELFSILHENGKDASGLIALIKHIGEMEGFIKQAEAGITDMKLQLDAMNEIQNHPVKSMLQKSSGALEANIGTIKRQIPELKSTVIQGCKQVVDAFKKKGVAALDKLSSFLHIKDGLVAIKNNIAKNIGECDRVVSRVNAFAKEYHSAGQAMKNMARILTGKQSVDTQKEAGKLAKTVSAPFRAEKSCLLALKKTTEQVIGILEQIERGADAVQAERTARPEESQKTGEHIVVPQDIRITPKQNPPQIQQSDLSKKYGLTSDERKEILHRAFSENKDENPEKRQSIFTKIENITAKNSMNPSMPRSGRGNNTRELAI